MPENKSDAYFRLFKIYLDNSLDSVELEKAYKRICRKKFSFQDNSENEYTLAVINLKLNYTYKPENGKPIKIKDLRAYFYENGFYLDGVHYVRYKRSAGSSREGKCLFIDERLYKAMDNWSSCGLKAQADLASWESYKALSLSSIKGTVNIPLDGILFVPDYKSIFTEEVISVELKDGKLVAEQKGTGVAFLFYGRCVASCGAEMKIWLDDLRHAPSEFVWCRSVNEAKKVIEENEKTQPIELIDCDHDLGDFFVDGGDGIKLLDWLLERNTLYPVALHTMNPVGRENMRRMLQRYWKERG